MRKDIRGQDKGKGCVSLHVCTAAVNYCTGAELLSGGNMGAAVYRHEWRQAKPNLKGFLTGWQE